jgi:hypothetical protein
MNIDPAEWERHCQKAIEETGKRLDEFLPSWPKFRVPRPIVETPERGPETLWIDKATFLLRRIDVQTQFGSFRTDCTTIYEPLLDVAIAENQLQFDPPQQLDL